MTDDIAFWGSLVSIVSACFGAALYIYSRFQRRGKVKKLESYLKNEKDTAAEGNKGQRTIMHLVRHTELSEDEILKISSKSKHILRKIRKSDNGDAGVLLFEYK